MDTGLIVALLVLFILMVLGLPIAYCFGIATLLAVALLGLRTTFLTSVAYQMVDSFALMAVLYFIFAGDLMGRGHLSDKIIELSYAIVGRMRAGLGNVIALASTFFGALSGSATATTAAIGGIMIPRMERYGYERRYSCALAAASGWLGALIPPSITLILYSMISDQSVGALFLSTVFPGLILAAFFIIINSYYGPRYMHAVPGLQTGGKPTLLSYFTGIGKATYPAIPALLTPVIILGGIYGGIFTPTEAGAVACLWAVIAGGFIYRKLKLSDAKKSLIDTSVLAASILIILTMVAILTRVLILERLPQMISAWLLGITTNKIILLLLINLAILVAGMFVDAVTLTIIITPLFIPTITSMGVNLIHFGAFLCVAIGIGSMTPPMAIAIFVASRVGNVPFQQIIKPILPFIILGCLPTLALATYVPEITLWLPRIIMGARFVGG